MSRVTLGQDSTDSSLLSVDPTILLFGIGLLGVASFFLGGRVEPQRKIREKKRSYYQQKLKDLAENPDKGERLLNLAKLTSVERSLELLRKVGDPKRMARMAAEELQRAADRGLI